MSLSIQGKTAIVTGAANGVGLAVARLFIDKGANVMMTDLDEETLKNEVGEMDDEGGTARWFAGDLREKLTVTERALRMAEEQVRALSIVPIKPPTD